MIEVTADNAIKAAWPAKYAYKAHVSSLVNKDLLLVMAYAAISKPTAITADNAIMYVQEARSAQAANAAELVSPVLHCAIISASIC
jgi:hypothetical protein